MASLTGPQIKHQNQFAAKTPDAQRRHDAGFFFAAGHPQKTQRLLPPDMVGRQNRQVTQAAKTAAQVAQRSAKTGQVVVAIKLIEFWAGHAQSMLQPTDQSDEEKAADFVGQFLAPVSIETFGDSFATTRANSPRKPGRHMLLVL